MSSNCIVVASDMYCLSVRVFSASINKSAKEFDGDQILLVTMHGAAPWNTVQKE